MFRRVPKTSSAVFSCSRRARSRRRQPGRRRVSSFSRRALVGFLALLLWPAPWSVVRAQVAAAPASPSDSWEQLRPAKPADFDARRVARLGEGAEQLEAWAARQVWDRRRPDADAILAAIDRLLAAKQQVDQLLTETFALRTQFVALPEEGRREKLRNYLEFTSRTIDLSGRMRYLLRDAIDTAAFDLDADLSQLERLLDLLSERRESIGAAVMSYVLFDPPPDSGFQPFPRTIRVKALRLISRAASPDLLPQLATFVRQPRNEPDLTIAAAEVIRRLGLPQDPIPGQDPTLPPPAITAAELRKILAPLDVRQLRPEFQRYHRELTAWLDERVRRGVTGDEFRVGNFRLRSGDWLLMRNPSPYNLFTDLSPGLFTHVGVVSVREFEDGIRRFVIVDLPERGDHVPATNVDTYLLRTLHYFFLRHEDPAVGRRMGEVAERLIGNPSVFDLEFRTDRVEQLRGKPLDEARIHTYCAGFLLVCAQETDAERREFFPIEELPAGGHCVENLKKLGLSLGENFVSPTGPLFSPRMRIVARREPMYSPDREVKEAVYDHFARLMVAEKLTPSPDALQALRQKVAELSRYNPWLARALARANNVSEHMDLESAAKAAAAIETLDEVAEGAAERYEAARQALLAGPLDRLPPEQREPKAVERVQDYRRRHADLYGRLTSGNLSPRELRIGLVEYYNRWGRERLEERFFPQAAASDSPPNLPSRAP